MADNGTDDTEDASRETGDDSNEDYYGNGERVRIANGRYRVDPARVDRIGADLIATVRDPTNVGR